MNQKNKQDDSLRSLSEAIAELVKQAFLEARAEAEARDKEEQEKRAKAVEPKGKVKVAEKAAH
jgi:hypothetical protein